MKGLILDLCSILALIKTATFLKEWKLQKINFEKFGLIWNLHCTLQWTIMLIFDSIKFQKISLSSTGLNFQRLRERWIDFQNNKSLKYDKQNNPKIQYLISFHKLKIKYSNS